MDRIFTKICQKPDNIISDIYNLFWTRYGFLKRIRGTLIFFHNPDGPLYQFMDYGIEKRVWYESFQSYDCKTEKTETLVKNSSISKIESSLPKKEKPNHLYIPNIREYTFSWGILQFTYGLYAPAREWPDYEIKRYDVLIDTDTHTAIMESKDEGYYKKIDL